MTFNPDEDWIVPLLRETPTQREKDTGQLDIGDWGLNERYYRNHYVLFAEPYEGCDE